MSAQLTMFLPQTPAPHAATAHHAAAPRWRQHWHRLSARERTSVAVAAGVVMVAVLWWGLLAPALATLRQAPVQHAALDAQLQTMQALAERARVLKAQPPIQRDDSLRALELATTRHLGATATLTFAGDQATVTLSATAATPLATWLADVRSNARLTPAEAKLSRVNTPPASWQGSVVFALNR